MPQHPAHRMVHSRKWRDFYYTTGLFHLFPAMAAPWRVSGTDTLICSTEKQFVALAIGTHLKTPKIAYTTKPVLTYAIKYRYRY
jgi:hypothetical protein